MVVDAVDVSVVADVTAGVAGTVVGHGVVLACSINNAAMVEEALAFDATVAAIMGAEALVVLLFDGIIFGLLSYAGSQGITTAVHSLEIVEAATGGDIIDGPADNYFDDHFNNDFDDHFNNDFNFAA